MTDIVTRLRDQLGYWNSGGRFQAADEIERLRAALATIANFEDGPVSVAAEIARKALGPND